jgi:excisionase family DNA binding protein
VQITLSLDETALDRLAAEIAERVTDRLSQQSEDGWMDSKEAAAYLKVPLSTLHKWTAEGTIPFTQDSPGARCFFLRSQLDRWRLGSVQGPRN